MEDSIFLRTRSQAPLPEASIDISRSPLKDARIASRSKASAAAEGIGSEEKDNAVVDGLEYSRKKLGDKRSPSPSNSDRFRLTKRFKSSPTGHNVAPSLAHARHLSDSSIFPKRSAVTSKPNSSSQSSTRHQSPTLPTKERAKSVPIFHSFRDFPVIDIRDIPTSPTRRTPKWEKLRITSTQKKLETIPDVPAESTPAKTTVPLRVSLEVTAIEPATPTFAKTIGMPANVILSPLTPLPETPRLQKLSGTADDAQDRFNAIRWGQDLLRPEEPLFVESTTAVKPPPVRNLRSRLPRPTNATASSLKARPESIAEKAAGTTPAITAPKQNAFDILMKKDQHRKGKGKAVEKPRAAALGGKAKFEASQTGEETKVKFPKAGSSKASTIKGKMKPRTKAQPQGKVPLIFDDEEEERPVEPLNEEVVYPLESLPTRDSLSPPNPPPRTSSPIFTPDVEDIRMTGVDDGILRMDNVGMDDVEMKAEDERVPEQDSTFPMEVESSVLIPEEAFQEAGPDIVPQVPSPLFTEVPSAAPSPLFSEPEFLDGKNPRDDPSPQNKPVETINASHNESTEVAADPLPSPPVDSSPRRTKASRLPPAPRATRSASSKMPTVEIPFSSESSG
ncbi:hypothetical protein GYMLUDRAFT_592114 [Collybiopsis luxurians FD-317 M1]|uniref:Unplaced genomic scaffold GYMLUscaffold_24, whole genome shotgun sequence n=1 Tax=Collybiopsis luxurians FD-317 M1 TaxID=944289 RepID=A0A0D0CF63_9AGAR|nr:hypothetical protein GYMLUDRAFT_592114 [Collybiopsis luxurians FD-317 M1]